MGQVLPEKGIPMTKVTVENRLYEVAPETKLYELAGIAYPGEEKKYVLSRQDGRLKELFHPVGEKDTSVEFITVAEEIGMRTYERSVVFLMMKAFRDVIGAGGASKVYVDYAVNNGLFCRIIGSEVTDEVLSKVTARMKELAEEDIPFVKEIVKCREAIRFFEEEGMTEKAKIMSYRRSSWVNMYTLVDYKDYFYAYLVPSTGYLKVFAMEKYESGFLLFMPKPKASQETNCLMEQRKLWETMENTAVWSEHLGLSSIGDLNERVVVGGANDLILLQEAIMEKTIGNIAETIYRSGKRVVLIAGPSSSGKTTFSHRLSIQLNALGLNLKPIACDNYFRNRDDYPLDENGKLDFESIKCVDTEQLSKDLKALLAGETIRVPSYDFVNGERLYKGDTMTVGKNDIIMIEGIHCLNDELTASMDNDIKFRIYIAALTTLNIDEHNYISTSDARLLRRIVRDARTRGYSAKNTIERWPSVRRGEAENIEPYMENADVMVNSALIYELSALKPYAEPLLFGVPRDSKAYEEAKRLLKFLDYILAIPSETVPTNSLVREFIGGGCFGE